MVWSKNIKQLYRLFFVWRGVVVFIMIIFTFLLYHIYHLDSFKQTRYQQERIGDASISISPRITTLKLTDMNNSPTKQQKWNCSNDDHFQNVKTHPAPKYKDHVIWSPALQWDDVHITVRTSKSNHNTKIALLAKTWFKTAEKQVYVITDKDDKGLANNPVFKLVNSGCGASHGRSHLCCKTGAECISFLETNGKWWCHFDDDVYVNTKQLLVLLNTLNSSEPIQLGRVYSHMLWGNEGSPVIWNLIRNETYFKHVAPWKWPPNSSLSERGKPFLHFVPGHAMCFSRPLVKIMEPWLKGDNFVKTCNFFEMSDDTSLALLVHHILKIPTTDSLLFHTEKQKHSRTLLHTELRKRVTYYFGAKPEKTIPFEFYKPAFTASEDPTRFMSLHCVLHPNDEICPK